MTITNRGSAPASFFVDGRSNQIATLPLLATPSSSYSSPDTALDAYPQFLVPPHTTHVELTASSTVPLAIDTQPYWGAAFYVGDPDVAGTTGTPAVVDIGAPRLASTTWVCDANALGPSSPQGTQASIQCTATATTNAFDPSVTSSTGDPWLRATEPDPPPLHPLVLQPGETGTIDVGFAPSAAPGRRVTGFLSIDTYDSVTHFGTEVGEIPYAYRVA